MPNGTRELRYRLSGSGLPVAPGATVVLHLHVNSFFRSDAHGAEAYYWPGNVLGSEVCDAILRAGVDYGARQWMQDHPGQVAWFDSDRPGYVVVDGPY